jgi:hypothetical protein
VRTGVGLRRRLRNVYDELSVTCERHFLMPMAGKSPAITSRN